MKFTIPNYLSRFSKNQLVVLIVIIFSAVALANYFYFKQSIATPDVEEENHDEVQEVHLSQVQLQSAGIQMATASPAIIRSVLHLPGQIRLNEDSTAHVVPRITGLVEQVRVNLGQTVKKGEVLAIISSPTVAELRSEWQSNYNRLQLARSTYVREKQLWEQKISAKQDYLGAESALHEAEINLSNATQKLNAMGLDTHIPAVLNRYSLRAPLSGIVIEKHLSLGEAVKEDAPVFTVSDLSTIWADISVHAKDLPLVRLGEKIKIRASAFDAVAEGKVTYLGAVIGEQTRTAQARLTIKNPQGLWRPGLFVNIEVTASETDAAVTIDPEALQTIEDKTVVFVRSKDGFVVQPVKVGRSDGKRVEIVQGLKTGDNYAAVGSFVLKAELGKGSAEHAH